MTYCELEVEFLGETDLAVLVGFHGCEEWIPKSCVDPDCEFEDWFFEEGEYFAIGIVEWKVHELAWDGWVEG